MNASQIINDDMTLEEKLAAIDKAMEIAQTTSQTIGGAPVDPSDATMCIGCQ